MKYNNFFKTLPFLAVVVLSSSCKKFLEEKPDKKLAIISKIQDLQALLDNHPKINYSEPSIAEICADNYFVTDAVFNARLETERNLYTWSGKNTFEPQFNAWSDIYNAVYISNTVIENSDKITEYENSDENELSNVKAQAYFHRARCFLNALSIWSFAYNESTSSIDLGIPLVRSTDFNMLNPRTTIKESYDQVLKDLKTSIHALPKKPLHPTRPSKAAAYGLIARTLLYMRKYQTSLLYADSCLQIHSKLMDYNDLSITSDFPISQINDEVIFESSFYPNATLVQSRSLINPELFNLYDDNDLRKDVFFKPFNNNYIFKGFYSGSTIYFNGIATDEILLTRAECYAKIGNLTDAMKDLNHLLENRYDKTNFNKKTASNTNEALLIIKNERRKELPFRGLRWMDIKRWNKDGDQINLKRSINGQTYSLSPNSPKYAISIPEDIISLTGMTQN